MSLPLLMGTQPRVSAPRKPWQSAALGLARAWGLAASGDSGRATTVPAGTASRRSMFAVSPDDQRIAVIVDDFNSTGASTKLYVEDLDGGGNHLDLFSQTGARTLWPVGWHGTNNLVVAVVASGTQGGGPFCCGPQELHVGDPQHQPRVGNVTNGSMVPVAAQGDCAGRLPGSL